MSESESLSGVPAFAPEIAAAIASVMNERGLKEFGAKTKRTQPSVGHLYFFTSGGFNCWLYADGTVESRYGVTGEVHVEPPTIISRAFAQHVMRAANG